MQQQKVISAKTYIYFTISLPNFNKILFFFFAFGFWKKIMVKFEFYQKQRVLYNPYSEIIKVDEHTTGLKCIGNMSACSEERITGSRVCFHSKTVSLGH